MFTGLGKIFKVIILWWAYTRLVAQVVVPLLQLLELAGCAFGAEVLRYYRDFDSSRPTCET